MPKKLIHLFVIGLFITLGSSAPSVYAGGCEEWVYPPNGMVVELTPEGKFKIKAFGRASVDFDDMDDIQDAEMEATLLAKALIVKFIKENLSTEEGVTREAQAIIKKEGTSKTVKKETAKGYLRDLHNKAEHVLRGVVPIANCYTKGKYVIVAVGIKPETVAVAQEAAATIIQSIASDPTLKSVPADSGSAGSSSTNSSSTNSSSSSSSSQSGTNKIPLNQLDSYNKGYENIATF